MFSDFQSLDLFPSSPGDILWNLVLALLCGLAIAFVYRRTANGSGYAPSFLNSLVLLTLITALVIMIIGNNLARAFGLVGAMSIIRFRTAVKDTIDIVFIFFALGVGLAAGSGSHAIAVTGTIFIGAVIMLLSRMPATAGRRREYLLRISLEGGDAASTAHLDVIERYCRKHRMVDVTARGGSEAMELSYYVHVKDAGRNQEFIRDLRAVPSIGHVSLFFDDEQY